MMTLKPLAFAAMSLITAAPAAADLIFNFTQGAELSGQNATVRTNVVNGFQEAGALWSDLLTDDVELNLTINFESLGATTLGATGNETAAVSYSNARTALLTDITSTDDLFAAAHLQTSPDLEFISNDRSGSDVLANGEAWSTVLDVARSNLKALGLLSPTDASSDGSISFSSDFSWDFDRSNGITGGTFDFVGVAAHEIGHLLGFTSGVDVIDILSGSSPNAGTDINGATSGIGEFPDFRIFSLLDLYRYSNDSLSNANQPAIGSLLDLRPGGTPFFSIDGGTTNIAPFSTGRENGDGQQASHWRDNLGLGILDPTFARGELGVISALDLQALDVIGWDLASSATVPEPSSFAVMLVLGVGWGLRRKRRQALQD